jgi:hypothetical protein
MSLASIRDTMITTVAGLTPTTLSGNRYKKHDQRMSDFRAWCEQNPGPAFRRFSIRGTGAQEPPEVTNTDVEWIWTEIEAVVAYPLDFRGGPQMTLDRDDLIEEDMRQIENAIGTNGYSTIESAGAGTVTTSSIEREPGQACDFGVLRLRTGFYRAMP